jgi:hydroxymethylglutaryl-CoA synthase
MIAKARQMDQTLSFHPLTIDDSDIYSLALTAVSSLLKKYSIDPKSIGRLEVGTETLLDKSKSVKTVLMQLFAPSGNTNVEGVDTVNACYGGTNALFNSVAWMESSAWDGRNAIVVAGDIALYKAGNARPTGGAGCIAMLITPDAPLVIEPGLRGSYIVHTYDFYKPDLTSEYPIVDGHYSIKCYTEAVDACYKAYNAREETLHNANGNNGTNGINGTNGTNGTTEGKVIETPLDRFDHIVFHAPTCKLVAKSYARLLYNDYLLNPSNPIFNSVPESVKDIDIVASLTDKTVEKTFMALANKRYQKAVQPSIQVPTMCGNMYCASVYASLVSLISNVSAEDISGRRIGVFSFGSGLASSFFSIRVRGSTEEMRQNLDIPNRLENRRVVNPEVYDEVSALCSQSNIKPEQR